MKNTDIIGFIGAGNMAGAIIKGLADNSYPEEKLYIYDINNSVYSNFCKIGLHTTKSIFEIVDLTDIVFLSVKPQNITQVLDEISKTQYKEKLFVSIVAGVSISKIQNKLPGAKVIRVMPNMPLLIKAGATALCRSENVTDEELDNIVNIFKLLGYVAILDEGKMNEVISINGSSPAYFYLFAKAVIDKAAEYNIDYNIAKELIAYTMIGSAKMLLNSDISPDKLIEMVASKGGTTHEALKTFKENKFEEIIKEAMDACTKRAYELNE